MALSARSILVTGANRGLGLEFVKQIVKLPNPPSYLFATCRDPNGAKELQELAASYSSVKVLKLEITDSADMKKLFESVSEEVGGEGLNLLINNAGGMIRANLDQITAEDMSKLFNTNTIAPLMLTKMFIPLLKQAANTSGVKELSCNKAAVINMSSIMASIAETSGGAYAYRSSKCALNMVTKCLSHDLAPEGILVMCFHPGWVQTDMGGSSAPVTIPDSISGMLNVMGRLGKDDVGKFYRHTGDTLPW